MTRFIDLNNRRVALIGPVAALLLAHGSIPVNSTVARGEVHSLPRAMVVSDATAAAPNGPLLSTSALDAFHRPAEPRLALSSGSSAEDTLDFNADSPFRHGGAADHRYPARIALPRESVVLSSEEAVWGPPPGHGVLLAAPPGATRTPGAEAEEIVASLPKDYRNGMFQKVKFESAWIDAGGAGGLGVTTLDLRCVLALPFFKKTTPLIITPGFGVHFLESPRPRPDLPAQVYDARTQFRHLRKLTEHLGLDAAVSVGWYSDFEQSAGDALRIRGHGMAAWEWSPRLTLVGGVVYLDRDDIPLLPVGGVFWNPTNEWRFELMFPKPKIARRIYWAGAPPTPEACDPVQDWLYLSGELGGGTWAVRRATGLDDELTYRDYRLILGLQRAAVGRPDFAFEIAYIFSREIEFEVDPATSNPPDSLMLRLLVDY